MPTNRCLGEIFAIFTKLDSSTYIHTTILQHFTMLLQYFYITLTILFNCRRHGGGGGVHSTRISYLPKNAQCEMSPKIQD